MAPRAPGGLTAREVEVLGLVARGPEQQIAERLYITPKTVAHHISHIYMTIGASNRVTASLYAVEPGLVHPRSAVGRRCGTRGRGTATRRPPSVTSLLWWP